MAEVNDEYISENLPPNPWGKELPRGRGKELCQKNLDDEDFIIFDFQKRGYKTMVTFLFNNVRNNPTV